MDRDKLLIEKVLDNQELSIIQIREINVST